MKNQSQRTVTVHVSRRGVTDPQGDYAHHRISYRDALTGAPLEEDDLLEADDGDACAHAIATARELGYEVPGPIRFRRAA